MLEPGPLDPVYEALCIRPPCFLLIICMTKNVQSSVAYMCGRVPWSASKVPQEVFAASLAAGNRQETGHEVGWTNESSTQAVLCWNNLTAVLHSFSVQVWKSLQIMLVFQYPFKAEGKEEGQKIQGRWRGVSLYFRSGNCWLWERISIREEIFIAEFITVFTAVYRRQKKSESFKNGFSRRWISVWHSMISYNTTLIDQSEGAYCSGYFTICTFQPGLFFALMKLY